MYFKLQLVTEIYSNEVPTVTVMVIEALVLFTEL